MAKKLRRFAQYECRPLDTARGNSFARLVEPTRRKTLHPFTKDEVPKGRRLESGSVRLSCCCHDVTLLRRCVLVVDVARSAAAFSLWAVCQGPLCALSVYYKNNISRAVVPSTRVSPPLFTSEIANRPWRNTLQGILE